MGVLMFRSWAGATAGLLVGSFGFSGAFAEGLGNSVTPLSGSQTSAAYFFAEANYSSRADTANFWGGVSTTGFAKTADSTDVTQTFAFVDFAPSSQFGVGLSPMSFVVNTPSKGMPTLTNSGTAVDTYFSVFEALSKRETRGVRPSASYITPMGGDSTSRRMR
jgi:hypothetical protein